MEVYVASRMVAAFLFVGSQLREVKERDATLSPTFIVKPDGGSQGEGIYLIREPGELRPAVAGAQARQAVVQEYIRKPLLVDKLKFDIRLYVLLKSLEPLEVYIAKEGLTRFCTEPYQVPPRPSYRLPLVVSLKGGDRGKGTWVRCPALTT